MVGDLKCRSRPYYFRRCKKDQRLTTTSGIDSLPDELLFSILVCLTADYLHDRARLVCRRWYRIIHSKSFINAQYLHHSTYCLLSYDYASGNPILMMTAATSQGVIQTNEFSYTLRGRFMDTCNGLVLEKLSRENNIIILQIINPATKKALILPPVTIPKGHTMYGTYCGIAYAAASMKYKVTISWYGSPAPYVAVMSVGVDNSWRELRIDQFLSEPYTRRLVSSEPLLTQGFVHWVHQIYGIIIVTLDVETEILTVSEVPLQKYGCSKPKFYLSTGRSLSVLIGRGLWGKESHFFELWEMNPETKEWMKMKDDIKFGDQQQQKQLRLQGIWPSVEMRPLGWLKYPEVLALFVNDCRRTRTTVISYNLDTHEIKSTEFPKQIGYYTHALYKSSLLWFT